MAFLRGFVERFKADGVFHNGYVVLVAVLARKPTTSPHYCLAFRHGFRLLVSHQDAPLRRYASAHDGRPSDTIRDDAVCVVRVIVVAVAVVVDVVGVVDVALIGRPQPPVIGASAYSHFYFIIFL